ncbi:hypothetical protein BKA82DRAFT_4015054 [Pisolithus tinctorius]|nr:hypothetical protein BKA82DRAFT_4015054 [Pisolithus tinctorius]
MILLATPFRDSAPQPFTFGSRSQWADITAQIRAYVPAMLRHRLTPPSRETYSLNRERWILTGYEARAVVDARELWDRIMSRYRFDRWQVRAVIWRLWMQIYPDPIQTWRRLGGTGGTYRWNDEDLGQRYRAQSQNPTFSVVDVLNNVIERYLWPLATSTIAEVVKTWELEEYE